MRTLRYGDPQVLAGMSRQQVEALRPTFGMDGTQHLLNKRGRAAEAPGQDGGHHRQAGLRRRGRIAWAF